MLDNVYQCMSFLEFQKFKQKKPGLSETKGKMQNAMITVIQYYCFNP